MNKLIPYSSEPVGFWRPVPGLPEYEASIEGKLRRRYENGYRLIKPFRKSSHHHSSISYVHVKIEGKIKEVNYPRLVYRAFHGEVPEGKIIVHKNGINIDHSPANLVAKDRNYSGEKFGRYASAKSVLQYDPDTMECTGAYKSARECARENHFSYQTIIDRCNGKVKYASSPDGKEYCWEESAVSYRWMLERIERSRKKG